MTVHQWLFETQYPLWFGGGLVLAIAVGTLLGKLEEKENHVSDEYISLNQVSRIRITRNDYGSEGTFFMIDGVDASGLRYTEEVWDYFDGKRMVNLPEAITAALAFADEYGLSREKVDVLSDIMDDPVLKWS